MNRKLVIAFITGLVVLSSTAALAGILASGPVFGGTSQRNAVCYVFNIGAPTQISSGAIRNQSGAIVASVTNTCNGATLPVFGTCAISIGPLAIQAYECTIQTLGTPVDLRGVMDIRDSTGKVLVNSDLH